MHKYKAVMAELNTMNSSFHNSRRKMLMSVTNCRCLFFFFFFVFSSPCSGSNKIAKESSVFSSTDTNKLSGNTEVNQWKPSPSPYSLNISTINQYGRYSSSSSPVLTFGCTTMSFQSFTASNNSSLSQHFLCNNNSYLNSTTKVNMFLKSCTNLTSGYFPYAFKHSQSVSDQTMFYDGDSECDSNVMLSQIKIYGQTPFPLWITYVKESKNGLYTLHDELCNCTKAIQRILEEFPNYALNVSISGSPKDMMRPIFLQTVQWSCPESVGGNEVRAVILANLWMKNKVLPQVCRGLLCNASIEDYRTNDTVIYFIVTSKHDLSKGCSQYAMRNSSFSDNIQIFSFDILETNTKLVFIVKESYDISTANNFFFILHHYADNLEFRNCCTVIPDYNQYTFEGNFYYMCNGNSTSCKSVNYIWLTERVFDNNYIVLMRDDDVDSKFIQWLATSRFQLSSSMNDFLVSLKHRDHLSGNNRRRYIFTSELDAESTEKLPFLLSELMTSDILCNKTDHFTICYKPDCLDCNIEAYVGYWIILYNNCSVSQTDDEQITLLLLSHFYDVGLDSEYLCQENIWTTSIEFLPKSHRFDDNNALRYPNVIHFLTFPLHSFQNSTEERFLLQRNLMNYNKTTNSSYKEIVSRFDSFSVTKYKVNPMNPVIMKALPPEEKRQMMFVKENIKLMKRSITPPKDECSDWFEKHIFSLLNNTMEGQMSLELVQPSFFLYCIWNFPPNTQYMILYPIEKVLTACWPCEYDMNISWNEKNISVTFEPHSDNCKTKQICLFCFTAVAALVAIIGNLVVLTVLIRSGLVRRKSFMIQTSMAVSDLFIALMSVSLSVYDQYCILNGYFMSHVKDPKKLFFLRQMDIFAIKSQRHGYPMVCGFMIFALGAVSLFLLTLFSIERLLVVTGHPPRRSIMVFGIFFCWIFGIGLQLLINLGLLVGSNSLESHEIFQTVYDFELRITANVILQENDFNIVIVSAILLASTIFIICSLVAIIFRKYKEKQIQKKFIIHHKNREAHIQHTTRTFLFMAFLFVVTTLPLIFYLFLFFLQISLNIQVIFLNNRLIQYVWLWSYMIGISSNWALYSFRGELFKTAAKQVICCSSTEKQDIRTRYQNRHTLGISLSPLKHRR